MFDPEPEIKNWRRRLDAEQVATAETLNELESHLRDGINQGIRSGLIPEKAFELAVARIGQPNALKTEFEKIDESPDVANQIRRLLLMERDIMLPVKIVFLGFLIYFIHASHWLRQVDEFPLSATQPIVWSYACLNLAVAALLISFRHLRLSSLHTAVFAMNVIDGLFLSFICIITGGYESPVYWVFFALIVRNSISIPRALSQWLLNASVVACYAAIAAFGLSLATNLTAGERAVLGLYLEPNGSENALIRVMLLLLTAILCAFGPAMLKRQRTPPTPAVRA